MNLTLAFGLGGAQDFVIACAVLLLLVSGKRLAGFGRRLGEGVAQFRSGGATPSGKMVGTLLPLGISLLLYCLFLVLATLSRR